MVPVVRVIVPCVSITSNYGHPPFSLHDVLFSLVPNVAPGSTLTISFSLFIAYTAVRQAGDFHLRILGGIDGKCVYLTDDFPAGLHSEPTTVFGQPIELADVTFPHPGQYSIHLHWGSEDIAQTYLDVRNANG